ALATFRSNGAVDDALALAAAAEEIARHDAALGREMLATALIAAVHSGAAPDDRRLADVARLVLAVTDRDGEGASDVLLQGLSVFYISGPAAAAPLLA